MEHPSLESCPSTESHPFLQGIFIHPYKGHLVSAKVIYISLRSYVCFVKNYPRRHYNLVSTPGRPQVYCHSNEPQEITHLTQNTFISTPKYLLEYCWGLLNIFHGSKLRNIPLSQLKRRVIASANKSVIYVLVLCLWMHQWRQQKTDMAESSKETQKSWSHLLILPWHYSGE